MGHDGYLIVNDKKFYRATSKSGEADMIRVTTSLCSLLSDLDPLYRREGNYPFPKHSGPPTEEDVLVMADRYATNHDLTKISKKDVPSAPTLAVLINSKDKVIQITPYTAGFLERDKVGPLFADMIEHGYAIFPHEIRIK